ncbi:MAG TPA: N-6 DNA methylase [Allosphingosinicella sp.]|jgi:hypothetical protein
MAELVREKIGRALRLLNVGDPIVGVLLGDPAGQGTEPALGVVVEFSASPEQHVLRELHKLAWNFSRSPTLITVEPGLLRVWTCCEPPDDNRPVTGFVVHEIPARDLRGDPRLVLENGLVNALHWINLVSGHFFVEREERFRRDGRADQTLLRNLRSLREELMRAGMTDDDICHDLLARVIFVQFLFDRRDADGTAALNPNQLKRLYAEQVLSRPFTSLAEILGSYEDTYRLFDWLNTKFNGDLFPAKGDLPEDRAAGWAREREVVRPEHLCLLADFVRGDLDLGTGQGWLWQHYSFDVIPLEFISSIYETFVADRAAKDGVFYTPPHLVDFVLDRVLPWNGVEWDLSVLDPSCGSGIFLVKAFQRLIHRWKRAHPGALVKAETLRRMLEKNLFGVDIDRHAVRVACFSLYLAMCDEIEPRHYWTKVVFPAMRGRRLICSDFFAEGSPSFSSRVNGSRYDLIIGNAPWGDNVVTPAAVDWAHSQKPCWTIANKDIGTLFLAKGGSLLRKCGRLAMIQSANAMLFNSAPKARAAQGELLSRYGIEAIYNLSALRFEVFRRKSHTTKTSIAPTCVVIMNPEPAASDAIIAYVSPKTLRPLDEFVIAIEHGDRNSVTVDEARRSPSVWSTLMWGSRRDRVLLERLRRQPTLNRAADEGKVIKRQGIRAGDQQKLDVRLADRRLFQEKEFPQDKPFYIDASSLPLAGAIKIHSRESSDLRAFELPQLLLKQGWQQGAKGFQARLVRSKDRSGVICSASYVSVHGDRSLLNKACAVYNSKVATYFLKLTSGRLAAYRPAVLVHQLLDVPLPEEELPPLETIEPAALDDAIMDGFALKDAERVLIDDLITYTLADFQGDHRSPGRQSTLDGSADGSEPILSQYCEYFARVLRAGFGPRKGIAATIFQPPSSRAMAHRVVAFELTKSGEVSLRCRAMDQAALLLEIDRLSRASRPSNGGTALLYNEETLRIYDGSSGQAVIYIVKPDRVRYWTRTAALNDADEVAADLFSWQDAEASVGRP